MATEGTWVLIETQGGAETRLCTSDIIETLTRVGDRRRGRDPALVHRVEINALPKKVYTDD